MGLLNFHSVLLFIPQYIKAEIILITKGLFIIYTYFPFLNWNFINTSYLAHNVANGDIVGSAQLTVRPPFAERDLKDREQNPSIAT